MTSISVIRQLEALFRQQLQAATELKQILADENDALIKREHAQVRRVTRLKEEKSAAIESLSNELRELLATVGLSLSQQSLDDIVVSAPSETADHLTQLRQKLGTVLQSCQDQNLVNGQVIAVNRQSAETALAILRGQFPAGNLTYGAAGQPISEQTSNQISKA